MGGQTPAFLFRQSVEYALRLGLGGEDPFDGVERVSAEADRPLERGEEIGAGIAALQRQDLEALLFAVALGGTQALEEACGDRAEFGEAFLQELLLLTKIGDRPMRGLLGTLAGLAAWEQAVPRDLVDTGAVNDQFGLGDTDRQGQADVPPGDRVGVLLIDDEAFDVDDAILDRSDLVRRDRQGNQVRPFLGMPIDRPLLGLAMHAHVGDLGQPMNRHFVEVFQRAEGSAVEQVGLGIMELPFNFSLRRSRRLHLICAVDEELSVSLTPFTRSAVASSRS